MQKEIRLNLTAAYIPLCVSFSGQQTVVRNVEDTNYVITNAYSGEGADKDLGIPMVIYGENILPTIQGMQSISYKQQTQPLGNGQISNFNEAIILRDKNESRTLFCPANGTNYILNNGAWLSFPFPLKNSGMVTHAYSNQRTFIFYANTGAYEYTINGFSRVTLAGLEVANISGITNANNYLIAWDSKRIYYSSAINPTDFIPSLSSGAGSEFVTKVRGAIVCCLPTADGFIIYTTANAVLATYTDNIRYPWRYKEIEGSAGINKPEHVSYDANYSGHFVWTESGLMMYSQGKASIIFPEITDFISNKLVEEYIGETGKQNHVNEAAVFSSETQDFHSRPYGDNGIVEYHLLNQAHVKLTFVGSRYFAFSYGYRNKHYDWVIVYDFGLRRFGKLKIHHSDCFHSVPTPGSELVPKEIFGFLQPNGAVVLVDFSDMATDGGVLLLGRIQHTRGKLLEVQETELSSSRPSDITLHILPSNDGKNFLPAVLPQEAIKERNYSRWHSRVTVKNCVLAIKGTFNLVDTLLKVVVKGVK
jgi:hypothetical protein